MKTKGPKMTSLLCQLLTHTDGQRGLAFVSSVSILFIHICTWLRQIFMAACP